MLCPNCKKEIADGSQFCSGCGASLAAPVYSAPAAHAVAEKKKKPVTKKWWFWVIIAVVLIVLIGSFGGGDDEEQSTPAGGESISHNNEADTPENNDVQTPETTTETTTATTTVATTVAEISESEYKALCVNVPYKDIARQPDAYKGEKVCFTGEVMQVQESSFSSKTVLLIQVTKDEYGYWDDLVYVTYELPDGAPRILEDDIVKFYGECEGTYTYETVMGSSNTIPGVSALYVDIQ